MKAILFDFFNYFVFFYTSFLAVSFIVMMFLSFISLKLRRSYYDDNYVRKVLSESPYTPGVSVIAPAYNEEKTIIDNVDSMLGLDYPLFEVVIVNDGSRDSTLDKLIERYELVEVPFAYIERIKTQPFRRVLKSTNPEYHRLIVVDKENGGTKADASNAGINAAQYPYFICTDVDCILRRDALYRCIWPVLSSSKHVIAVSGTMRMANGCKIENGQVVEVRPPHTPIPLFQNLEYMRSYLVGKMGWSAINAMPNVSGGFGLFDRQIAIAAGGYDPMSFAEDMDLLARMVGYMCDFSRPYKVVQVPETCCWTEGPPNLVVLYRQRTRWGRGLFQALMIHRKMIFNKTYRQTGLVTLPYMVIFEFLAPIIEATGFILFLFLAFTGAVNWHTMWVIFLAIYLFCQFLSLVVVAYDYYLGTLYRRGYEYIWIIAASILEPFIYHPLITFFSLKGYLNHLMSRDYKWGKMTRKGFSQREEPIPMDGPKVPPPPHLEGFPVMISKPCGQYEEFDTNLDKIPVCGLCVSTGPGAPARRSAGHDAGRVRRKGPGLFLRRAVGGGQAVARRGSGQVRPRLEPAIPDGQILVPRAGLRQVALLPAQGRRPQLRQRRGQAAAGRRRGHHAELLQRHLLRQRTAGGESLLAGVVAA